MFEIKEKPKLVEKALLVGVQVISGPPEDTASLLEELEELVLSLGIPVGERLLAKIQKPQAQYYLGTGKAKEICDRAKEIGADVIVFDHSLTPGQQRNWEELSGLCVIDREEVILDIFASRASTKEARLQVGLARMEYSLPRLTRAWGHLGRQAGGVGGKGEGESQLETDRRLVRKRIDHLKAELLAVRSTRATQRKARERLPVPQAAIVGYTNAGKSSLLRALTGAQVLVEDKVFATLDPTTRRLELPTKQELLITDTVGFVRKLPHRLVEAFKATLEEAVLADFLVHVLDASHPEVFEFHRTTMQVLEDLGAHDKRIITVFNKIDLITDRSRFLELKRHVPDGLFVSILKGEGMEDLLHRMSDMIADRITRYEFLLPHDRADLVSLLHRSGNVLSTHYEDDGVRVQATIPPKLLPQFKAFQVVHTAPKRKKKKPAIKAPAVA